MPMTRLDKIVTDAGVASRSEARALIKAGRVKVCDAVVRAVDAKFDPEIDQIKVDGGLINGVKLRYYIINKPSDCITATEDRKQKTVLDIFPIELRKIGLFPVGRLDKDTTGLLIFTNDGDYAHRVISPKQHVEKAYLAEIARPLDDKAVSRFARGITLKDGTKCESAKLEIISENQCRVVICEGKYHQVKRMIAACGSHVLSLHRERIGRLELAENQAQGEIVELTNGAENLVFED